MSDKNIYACSDLAEYAPTFTENGCVDSIATKLKNDKGIADTSSSSHTDCTDLNDINDCYVGTAPALTDGYEDCDWKQYIIDLFKKIYEFNKSIISAICGLWTSIHKIEKALDGYTFRTYSTTCGKENFQKTIVGSGSSSAVCYFGQNSAEPGYAIYIPIDDMDKVTAVFAQTRVVSGRTFPATVTIQSYYQKGNYLVVDLDPYEWCSLEVADTDLVPYDLPVDFLILGTKN